MKRFILYSVLFFLGILITSFLMKPQDEKEYSLEWKKVDALVQQGLPRSAIQVVDSIFIEAKAEGNETQYIKALIYRVSLQGQFEEDHLVGAINIFQTELITANGVEKQLMQSLLAELYYRYYTENRWLINERTTVEGVEDDDIHTWDAVKLNETISGLYLASIANPRELEAVPLPEFSAILLNTEKSGFVLWPSLYDLLANRALNYFSSNDSELSDIGSSLNIPAAQLFSPVQQFVVMQLPAEDSLSYKSRTIHIYQQLLAFHLKNKNPEPLVDLDLRRLDFARSQLVSNDMNDSLYTVALESLYNKYQNDSVFVKIAFRLASHYQSLANKYEPLQGDQNRWWLNKAEEVCQKAIQTYPKANETAACRNLLNTINEVDFGFQMNAASMPDEPILAYLNFKNTKKIYFKIVKIDPAKDMENRVSNSEYVSIRKYLKQASFKEWSQELPDTKDHQMHATEIIVPALPLGYYMVFASDNPKFNDESYLEYNSIWISSLSYLTKNNKQMGSLELYVLDRESGNALSDVAISVFERKYNSSSRQFQFNKLGNYVSDKAGYASIKDLSDQTRNSLFLIFSKNGDTLHSAKNVSIYKSKNVSRTTTRTYFFTDRAIYRPGQTVYFKGIVVDKTGAEVSIKTDYSTTVDFYDANQKEISSMDVITNEFGSFHGAFVIPRGGLNGKFRIKSKTGTTHFSVEEYKRPTFTVNFDTLEGQYKLGDEISVSGQAMNFAGSAVGGATVKYRVVRTEIMLPYFRFYRPFPQQRETEIAHGTTTTEMDGIFDVRFVAEDDELQSGNIPFDFIVYADVTDITGEVQSAQTHVAVGKDAVILGIDIPEMLQKGSVEKINLSATNLSGAPLDIQARVEVFRLTPPTRLLNKRYWSRPDINLLSREEFIQNFPHDIYGNENDKTTWPRKSFTDSEVLIKNGKSDLNSILSLNSPGEYLVKVTALNQSGDTVKAEHYFTVYSIDSNELPANEISWNVVSTNKAEPGETLQVVVGSAAPKSRFLVEIVNGDKVVERSWVNVSKGQKAISVPVSEDYRGNFALSVQMIRFNRFYDNTYTIEVPFTNKKLDITLETHRDFLFPGQKEEWRVKISGPGGEKLAAELMAGMYDASLDQFISNSWTMDLYHSKSNNAAWNSEYFNGENSSYLFSKPIDYINSKPVIYPQINWFGYEGFYGRMLTEYAVMGAPKNGLTRTDQLLVDDVDFEMDQKDFPAETQNGDDDLPPTTENVGEDQPSPLRTNFNETAFFYPQLKTDSLGNVVFTFTTPDALTEWRLMMLATTKDLKTGQLLEYFKSKKDLMIIPNVPRFVRQGDMLQFSAKVINYTEEDINAEATIEFFDAITLEPVNIFYNNTKAVKNQTIPAMENAEVNWQILIPFDISMLGYRVTAKTGVFTDGEERIFPVLTNRMLVTESMPLNVNGKQTKSFDFKKLTDSHKLMMSTRQNYRFTLEYTSNPAWYAVQALPYLNEPTVENSSALFNTFYVNIMSAFIVNSNPKIKNVFASWQSLTPETFFSKLQSNEELKNAVLNATPWVLEAEDETEQKRRIGILFDANRIAAQEQTALSKLMASQMPGGAWPWFKGMKEDRHTTQKIILGIAKLNSKGILILKTDNRLKSMVRKAVSYLDAVIKEDYEKLKKNNPQKDLDKRVPGSLQIEYLYMRSMLMDLYPLSEESKEAFNYYQTQVKKYWLNQDIYLQVMTSLALYHLGNKDEAEAIMRSIQEKALISDEMGMYWRKESGWYWYQAPVETQSLIIEALDEISNNQKAVEQAKIWLLKQKQSTHWKTNQATVEAVYALLMTGAPLLADNQLAIIKVGGNRVDLSQEKLPEAGTGYFKKSWSGKEVTSQLGNIEITNPNSGISWGGAYWQYFENLDRITKSESPLKIDKQLFIETLTDNGPVLQPLQENQNLKPGDKVVSRLIITTDRDMEYVQLTDMRATAFEPTDHLSGYVYSGGLGYYKNISDVSTDFFIQYLNKGTYMLEYPVMVTQKGEFTNGIATLQCYYAPEFSAHSEGLRIVVE